MISSSHDEVLNTSISEERNIDFNFVNINLPDSTSNQAESQGYVTYTISPRSDLSTCTSIQNTASIYFDSNPPIVTNTTESIYCISCDDDNVCTVDDVLGKNGLCRGHSPIRIKMATTNVILVVLQKCLLILLVVLWEMSIMRNIFRH